MLKTRTGFVAISILGITDQGTISNVFSFECKSVLCCFKSRHRVRYAEDIHNNSLKCVRTESVNEPQESKAKLLQCSKDCSAGKANHTPCAKSRAKCYKCRRQRIHFVAAAAYARIAAQCCSRNTLTPVERSSNIMLYTAQKYTLQLCRIADQQRQLRCVCVCMYVEFVDFVLFSLLYKEAYS